ncbi:hypothetical protein KUTeg_017427, partial [Tegillarca granosa]
LAYLVVTIIKHEETQNVNICDDTSTNHEDDSASCDYKSQLPHSVLSVSRSHMFCDLSMREIRNVLKFLYTKSKMNLITPEKANLTTNFIYSIELFLPTKFNVISYIDGFGLKPSREAVVTIFMGQSKNRTVEEFIVGPLDKLNEMRLRRNPYSTSASYRVRQVPFVEVWGVYELMLTTPGLHKILEDSYGATVFDCITQIYKTNIPISYSRERKMWISLYYDLEYFTFYPVDFQLLVNIDDVDSTKWKIEKVWYANRLYESYEEFRFLYNNGSAPRTKRHFPSRERESLGSLHVRPNPNIYKRAPKQFEPDGHRYKICDQSVRYLKWQFNWQNSLLKGPTLFNINFNGERIVYELGLQDIIVLYTGNNPAFSRASFADGLNGLSSRTAGLVPGVDCPEHATFRNITIATEDFPMGGVIPNAICIFEQNLGTPLRRHQSSIPSQGGLFYGGLVTSVLIFRTIFVLNNYDYILDYILYESGSIEVKVHSTGYVLTTFQFPEESSYGSQVANDTNAPLHLHLFNFKIDIDILGRKNRYKTVNIEVGNIKENINRKSGHHFKLRHETKHSELEAAYKYNISTPKYHVFYNNDKNDKYGNPRGYRLEADGFVKQLIPTGMGFEDTISWSRYQMAVTIHKESERSSSSIHATFDAGDPVVDFSKFVEDNESIVDEDLVAWLTLGTYHIPHTEDVPNVVTSGKELSFLLSPFNYFPNDPSVHSYDAVRMTPKESASGSEKGLNIEGNINNYTCIPRQYNYESLKKDGSAIFYSLA